MSAGPAVNIKHLKELSSVDGLAQPRNGNVLWLWAVLAFSVCFLAINNDSFWIDEALTGVKSSQRTVSDWLGLMAVERGSDLQMPFYMIYMWGFEKLVGAGEWALRTGNIPWFVAGFLVVIAATPQRGQKVAAALVIACSSFAWYYLNEARPYSMQLGACLMLLGCLLRFSDVSKLSPKSEFWWVALFCFALLTLCGSSLLGMIWGAAAVLGAWIILYQRGWRPVNRFSLIAIFFSLFILAGLSLYYFWTIKIGAGAVGHTDFRSFPFILYELLGFSGLGPGRLEIREMGAASFKPFVWALIPYGLLLLVILVVACRDLFVSNNRPRFFILAFIGLAPFAFLLAAGVALHFRVLGRHCMPLLGVVLFLTGYGVDKLWSRGNVLPRAAVCLFLIFSLASCLSIRFAARHRKDDYRGASAFALTALKNGQEVWWNASNHGARYYGVPLAETSGPASGKALLLVNPTAQILAEIPAPGLVIMSKGDLYDESGIIAGFLQKAGYTKIATWHAFSAWAPKHR